MEWLETALKKKMMPQSPILSEQVFLRKVSIFAYVIYLQMFLQCYVNMLSQQVMKLINFLVPTRCCLDCHKSKINKLFIHSIDFRVESGLKIRI